MRLAVLYWATLSPWMENRDALGNLTPMYPYFEDRDSSIAAMLEQTRDFYQTLSEENGLQCNPRDASNQPER